MSPFWRWEGVAGSATTKAFTLAHPMRNNHPGGDAPTDDHYQFPEYLQWLPAGQPNRTIMPASPSDELYGCMANNNGSIVIV